MRKPEYTSKYEEDKELVQTWYMNAISLSLGSYGKRFPIKTMVKLTWTESEQ